MDRAWDIGMTPAPRLAALVLCALAGSGCGDPTIDLGPADGGGDGGGGNYGFPPGSDLAGLDLTGGGVTPCGDNQPGCQTASFGPPGHQFSLRSDPMPDPNESDNGVDRDGNGWLGLSASHANFDFLWLANTNDWNIGSVSKVNSKTVRETARYFTVTCFSNPGGSRAACDGTNGCCTRDDYARFQQRAQMQPDGPHQTVNASGNVPSRTAVDYNGDVWVANRAFGLQSSVSKIANDPSECTDRNGTPGIQTSSDVNGDGVIDTDCNRNGVPDDVADVQAKPCENGMAQEFYGLDDECVLFTTNTNEPDKWGRPLALGPGETDFGPSDAWAGCYQDGKFFRVDGTTGQIKDQTQVPHVDGTGPYGAAIDAAGIAWVTYLASGLSVFDAKQPAMTAKVRDPNGFAVSGYGITLDRDQNVWTGGYGTGHAYRYTPDRSNGFAKLSTGLWTVVNTPGANAGANGNGRGIAADARTAQTYFVWMARDGGFVTRIAASAISLPNGQDQSVDGSAMPAMRVDGSNTIGAGVDRDQNIWGISYGGSVATRIKVDQAGNMTPPDIQNGTPHMGCPVGGGDRCTLQFGGNPDPQPYTYSDFTGFGLRNFTDPKGDYSVIQKGCYSGDTQWANVTWDATVPPNTKLTLRARSGMTPTPDGSWGPWSADLDASPADLKTAVMPNPAPYLQVEFDFTTTDRSSTAKLKSFSINYLCLNGIG